MKATIFASTVVELVVVFVLWSAHGCGDGTVLTECVKDADCAAIPEGCCRAGRCEVAAVCSPEPFCGNGLREPGEGCDGSDLGRQTCQTLGYSTGELRCLPSCLFDLSLCRPAKSCGDGKVDSDEECDGSNLAGKTCASLGFSGGTLVCDATCALDESACTPKDTCGDGKRVSGEECDGEDLGGQSCSTRGFGGGELTCASDCEFDTSGCIPADGTLTTNMKCAEDLWFGELSTLNSRIDIAASYGFNWYDTGINPNYISDIKNGNTDHFSSAINHAHSKGMKFMILFSAFEKYTGSNRNDFRTNSGAQDRFLSDIEWVLQRYPNLDGLQLEEPVFDVAQSSTITPEGYANMAFLNDLFSRAKVIVEKYRSLDDFLWSFNSPSNSATNVANSGIDVHYINTNRTFNSFFIQNAGGGTLSGYQDTVPMWKSRFPNLEIVSAVFVTYTSIYNPPPCDGSGNIPACWNQALFDQIGWSQSTRVPVLIFVLGRLDRPASMWPSDTTPGATAGDKIKYIWDTTP